MLGHFTRRLTRRVKVGVRLKVEGSKREMGDVSAVWITDPMQIWTFGRQHAAATDLLEQSRWETTVTPVSAHSARRIRQTQYQTAT